MKPLEINVLSFGIQPDTDMDCTAAFQQALDAAGEMRGAVVGVPAGRYRLDGNLRIPACVTLRGVSDVPPTAGHAGDPQGRTSLVELPGEQAGTVLLVYAGRNDPQGEPFITLAGDQSTVEGLTFLYPEMDGKTIPPVPYPPTIGNRKGVTNVGIRNVLFLGSYEAIRMVSAPRHHIDRVTGYPLKRGILVDDCGDIGHIDNVHFWPFGFYRYNTVDGLGGWVAQNGVAYEIARADWEYVSNTFCFGYGIGYKFSPGADPNTGLGGGGMNGQFSGIGADSCQRAVYVEAALPFGVLITNSILTGRWKSLDAVCLEIAPGANCTFQIHNSTLSGPVQHAVWLRDPKSQLSLNGCHFGGWADSAIRLDAGMATITGCSFDYPCDMNVPLYDQAMEALLEQVPHYDTCVRVGKDVTCALMTGNLAVKGFQVDNKAGDKAQMFCNQQA